MIRRAHGCAESGLESRSGAVAAGNGRQDGRFGSARRNSVTLTGSLVAAKEEQFILLNGSAERAAELVLLQHLLSRFAGGIVAVVEEIVRVQIAVAEEFKQRSMEVVGAGLGDNVDICAGVTPVTGVIS